MKSGTSSSSYFLRVPQRWMELLWVGLLAWLSLSVLFSSFRPPATILFAFLAIVSWKKSFHVLPTLLLFGVWFLLPQITSGFQISPMLVFALPLIITLPFLLMIPKKYFQWSWMRRGDVDFVTILTIVLLTLAYSAGVILWAALTNNLSSGLGLVKDLESVPKSFLLLAGVPVFSFMAALIEEVMFRGVLQEFFHKNFSEFVIPGILFAAFVFAASRHLSGFPSGLTGFFLTFLFGCALGYLRWRTGGIWASFFAHFSADLIIGVTFTFLAR